MLWLEKHLLLVASESESQIKVTTETEPSELQIRAGIEDNSKVNFIFLKENISWNPALEPSRQDGFNEESQLLFFFWKIMENILKLSRLPLLIQSNDLGTYEWLCIKRYLSYICIKTLHPPKYTRQVCKQSIIQYHLWVSPFV